MQRLRCWIEWHFWQFIAGFWALLCLLLVYLGLMPRVSILMDSYEVWLLNEQTIAGMSDWEARSSGLTDQIDALKQRVNTLYISIPRNDQISVILDCLQQSTEGVEVALRQIKTEAQVVYGDHQEQPMHVLAGGEFHALAVFIDRIEKSPYLIKVTELEIKRGDRLKELLSAELALNAMVVQR